MPSNDKVAGMRHFDGRQGVYLHKPSNKHLAQGYAAFIRYGPKHVIYDRAREGTEQHIYRFLMDSLKELLTRERKRKNRDRIARSHGDKYGAAASTSPGRTSSPSGRGGRSQSPRPRSPGTYALNPQSPETLDGWFSKLGSILRSPN